MHVCTGRDATIEGDRALTRTLCEHTARTAEPGVRVWQPPRQLTFGRRDRHESGYEQARSIAMRAGFPPAERPVGGRAVAYTGSTVAFARTEPVTDIRTSIQDRYEAITTDIQAGLSSLGVHARPGEPPASFCPGSHSLQAGGKLAGIAQRITDDVALTAGCLVVSDHEEIAAVLTPVYEALSLSFDPDSVASVAAAGGPDDPAEICVAVENALVEGTPTRTG